MTEYPTSHGGRQAAASAVPQTGQSSRPPRGSEDAHGPAGDPARDPRQAMQQAADASPAPDPADRPRRGRGAADHDGAGVTSPAPVDHDAEGPSHGPAAPPGTDGTPSRPRPDADDDPAPAAGTSRGRGRPGTPRGAQGREAPRGAAGTRNGAESSGGPHRAEDSRARRRPERPGKRPADRGAPNPESTGSTAADRNAAAATGRNAAGAADRLPAGPAETAGGRGVTDAADRNAAAAAARRGQAAGPAREHGEGPGGRGPVIGHQRAASEPAPEGTGQVAAGSGAEAGAAAGTPERGAAGGVGDRSAVDAADRSAGPGSVPGPARGTAPDPTPGAPAAPGTAAPAAPAAESGDGLGDESPAEGGTATLATAAVVTDGGTRDGDRLRFVGAATRRIARGIDLDEIVLGLCRATVPTFSDVILVYLRDPLPVGDERPVGPVVLRLRRTDRIPQEADSDTGSGGRLPVLTMQPDYPQAADRAEVRPGGPLAEVLRGVRPVFGESAAARAALPELLGEAYSIPCGQRAVLAPLRGRRRVIGAAVFLRRPDRPAFEADDLLVAAQLATHTALGVDKAVLYGREAYIADALQRTMLPETLPQPTGVRLASRYLPAAETARVGGDWYDAIPLPGSRVALVVGDVMGHSMTSAAIMGQLRTTAQTLAGLDLPPQEVLHHLDEQAQRLGSDRMATCLYAVYDPVAHRIMVANAGHPPPVLLHLGGHAEVLRVPPGAPIGVGGVDFEAVELPAPAGATLLLYTDGLVESRLRDVWTGIERLREKMAATARLTGVDHPPPLEPLCDEVLDIVGPGDRDDDIALLAARFDGIPPSDVAYWFLDPHEQAPGKARRLARQALERWNLEELTDSVELLISEVVTNAVRYAERPITLRLLRTELLRCEVGDDVPQLPRLRQARPSDEDGRGLYLVNRLARRWGATRLSTGKVVWFELARPTSRTP